MKKKFHGLTLRTKLMLAICLVSFSVLMLLWLATGRLLQRTYNSFLQNDLENSTERLASLFDEACSNGDTISQRTLFGLELDTDFWSKVNEELSSGNIRVDNCCVDISDETLRSVNYVENLQPCLLHESDFGRFGNRDMDGRNSSIVVSVRREVFEKGTLYKVLETPGGTRQMVVGRTAADGQYAIILSTGLARIDEAGKVMSSLLPPLAIFIFILSVMVSWALSRWIAAPLTRLSDAARKMAGGDYDARVPENGSADEIGLLAKDFNYMASQVKQASLLQQQLLANVSHDLRTPLTLIKGYAETVRDISGDNKDRRNEQMNIIIDETDRLSGLVNSVMEYSKVSSGTEQPDKVRFDMSELAEEVAERYDAVCEQKGWKLELDLKPAMVYADPGMMERVLHNLMGNATHHMGGDNWFCLRVKPLPEGGCRVEVSDHGPGINPEDLPHLFDRYYRSRSDSGKVGTGLGLSISKAIFRSHGFRFGVDSRLGEGSTFWFIMTEEKPPEQKALPQPPARQ